MLDILFGILYAAEIVVGLGLLIFIHEFGHFVMAKRNGVKVEAFSLGMGPILWKRLWRGTEYRISWIPLGGYVKMAGENIGDPRTGAPDELTSKSAWQRLQIFAAGALMNLIIAVPIAMLAFLWGRQVQVAVVAAPGHPESIAGMRPGDVIVEVNGKAIDRMDEYRKEMLGRPQGELVPVKVRRGGEVKELLVKQSGSERHVQTTPQQTTLAHVKPGSPAWQAGMREGDQILEIDGQQALSAVQVYGALRGAVGREVTMKLRRAEPTGTDVTVKLTPTAKTQNVWPEDGRLMEAIIEEAVEGGPADVPLGDSRFLEKGDVITKVGDREVKHWKDLKDVIEASPGRPVLVTRMRGASSASMEIVPMHRIGGVGQMGVKPLATAKIVHVAEGSTYYNDGLRSGDVILSIDKLTPKGGGWWGTPKKEVVDTTGQVSVQDFFSPLDNRALKRVKVRRGTEEKELTLHASEEPSPDLEGLGLARGDGGFLAFNMYYRRWGWGEAAGDSLSEPVEIAKLTFITLKKLVLRQESTKNLAGPLGIFQASFIHAKFGFGNFLYLLLLITVNLGVFNLLPIPVLDGGHILLLGIEKVRGHPPSPRFVERFQMVGLALLLTLIVFVTYNDVGRIWGG